MKRIPATLLAATLAATAAAQSELHTFVGPSIESYFGYSVDIAGDVDNDGVADLAIGAHKDGIPPYSDSGSVTVFSGASFTELFKVYGTGLDRFGYSVSDMGDVNGDGRDDIVVGAPQTYLGGNPGGYASLLSGNGGAQLYKWFGDLKDDQFGWTVRGAGDVDNDGFPDVVVGTPQARTGGVKDSGLVRVLSGATGNVLHQFGGTAVDEFVGWSVSGAGDIDGDGFDDVVYGAIGHDTAYFLNAGRAEVRSGKTGSILYTFEGLSSLDSFGSAVSGGGDTNGDGTPDVVICAPNDDTSGFPVGAVRVYSGQNGGLLHLFYGATADEYECEVDGTGDVNGDGYDDIAVGANSYSSVSGSAPGLAHVFSGKDGTELATFHGDVIDDYFGRSVSIGGDVTGNGFSDVLIGASQSLKAPGYARLFSGSCGRFEPYGAGCPGTAGFVPALAFSGCASSLGTVSLSVTGGLGLDGTPNPPSMALIMFGFSAVAIPVGSSGCTLLAAPLLPGVIALPLKGSGAGKGAVMVTGVLPANVLAGTVRSQAFLTDIGTPRGFSATNGVAIRID